MKASEQLKRELIGQMRTTVAGRELDVSQVQIELDFTSELPSEYEGCRSLYRASVVKLVDGQLVVAAESDNDETVCDEAALLTLSVESIEALADAVQAAASSAKP
ncbi:MAG: hypothetical protein L0211_26925 [Planctomycetaceae bacterium]|nr:hypothetical protein [Planctomycetaceae bacterium]